MLSPTNTSEQPKEKGKNMKAMKSAATFASLSALALLALIALGCASSGDKPRVRVYEEKQYIQLRHVPDTAAPLNLKKGDAIAMACTKCKTVLYASVDKPRTRFFTPLEHRHYCPGCKSTITVTGAGLKSKEEVKHTCDACGSASVFCCATNREAPPTAGMEKK